MNWLLDKIFGWIFNNSGLFFSISIIFTLLFWVGIISIAIHFITKYW